jgi:hypothetical protein
MLDEKLSEHKEERIREPYLTGWADGRKAARDAFRQAEKDYGYSPSIIRAQDVT